MSRGRPAGIRSAPLTGTGGPLSADQWEAVKDALLEYYDEAALKRSSFAGTAEALATHHSCRVTSDRAAQVTAKQAPPISGEPVASKALNDLFARYQTQVEAESKVVGVEAERADLHAIAKDCRHLAELLPVEPIENWPSPLCSRLLNRLVAFPPIAEAALSATGVDVWRLLERLREAVPRPHLWAATPTLSGDLHALAEACELSVEQDTRTQPARTARDGFVHRLAELIEATPPTYEDSRSEREALIRDMCDALGIPAPDRPYAKARRRLD